MSGEPITFYDRYEQAYRREAVYGEGALRFAYETIPGRALAWLFFSRPVLSRLFGWYMRRPQSAARVRPFVGKYQLDAGEFARGLDQYASFNEFFCRELRPGARPVDAHPDSVVFPADARHFGWQELGAEQGIFVKGQRWDLPRLLGGDAALVKRFSGGSLVLSRLCPVDYHHFHFPAGGAVRETRWLGWRLYSVSPYALRQAIGYLWENKRCLTLLETGLFGRVCFIEVGATNVGTIRHRPLPGDGRVSKGDPKGWFEFGGSSVITLFEPGRVQLASDLTGMTARGTELYARVGDRMGLARKA